MKSMNQMTERELMNLPEHYESSVLETLLHMNELRQKNVDELVDIISLEETNLAKRFTSATLLALIGDVRISPLDPVMMTIPQATVSIGATQEEIDIAHNQYEKLGVLKSWLLKECPKHEITLPFFKLSKYLITNYEYLLFLKDTKKTNMPSSWRFGIYDPAKANHPVYGILPEDADHYAIWLSKKTNRTFRLPTEYEWEYAAAGLSRNEFPWGNIFSIDKANTVEGKIFSTTPVGIYPQGASPFGCLDMAGNVEEFVSNNYFCYPNGTAIQDDLGGENEYRIARGGSFTRHADLARCRRRHGLYNKDVYVIGFRLAEEIKE